MAYGRFYKRYLMEMPRQVSGGNPYEYIKREIETELSAGKKPIDLGDNTFKISIGDSSFYWIASLDGKDILLCSNVSPLGKFAKVNSTGKNPTLISKPPYAIDLYLKIANDMPAGVRFASDTTLSNDGFKIWSKIFQLNYTVGVYNNQSEKYQVDKITSMAELDKYFKEHPDFENYQYVLGESDYISEMRGQFHIMEFKRLAGYPLQESFHTSSALREI